MTNKPFCARSLTIFGEDHFLKKIPRKNILLQALHLLGAALIGALQIYHLWS